MAVVRRWRGRGALFSSSSLAMGLAAKRHSMAMYMVAVLMVASAVTARRGRGSRCSTWIGHKSRDRTRFGPRRGVLGTVVPSSSVSSASLGSFRSPCAAAASFRTRGDRRTAGHALRIVVGDSVESDKSVPALTLADAVRALDLL